MRVNVVASDFNPEIIKAVGGKENLDKIPAVDLRMHELDGLYFKPQEVGVKITAPVMKGYSIEGPIVCNRVYEQGAFLVTRYVKRLEYHTEHKPKVYYSVYYNNSGNPAYASESRIENIWDELKILIEGNHPNKILV